MNGVDGQVYLVLQGWGRRRDGRTGPERRGWGLALAVTWEAS